MFLSSVVSLREVHLGAENKGNRTGLMWKSDLGALSVGMERRGKAAAAPSKGRLIM